ncbi:hypothetical protein WMY93_009521 [Mugilogobius chulae]|uniref:Uncharacterized protein n=1 Tax=Mugilogobius chulae TaxID=88201 RepID=A0AAW0PQB8_9GOBI
MACQSYVLLLHPAQPPLTGKTQPSPFMKTALPISLQSGRSKSQTWISKNPQLKVTQDEDAIITTLRARALRCRVQLKEVRQCVALSTERQDRRQEQWPEEEEGLREVRGAERAARSVFVLLGISSAGAPLKGGLKGPNLAQQDEFSRYLWVYKSTRNHLERLPPYGLSRVSNPRTNQKASLQEEAGFTDVKSASARRHAHSKTTNMATRADAGTAAKAID